MESTWQSGLPEFTSLLQVVGKDVEHELGIRVGVDMPVSLGIECLSEFKGVDQVSVLIRSASTDKCTTKMNVRERNRYRRES